MIDKFISENLLGGRAPSKEITQYFGALSKSYGEIVLISFLRSKLPFITAKKYNNQSHLLNMLKKIVASEIAVYDKRIKLAKEIEEDELSTQSLYVPKQEKPYKQSKNYDIFSKELR